ncbi:hypothetical protein Y694_03229 [Methylibium sp. T29-B]|nr:hypothetical protein Y694_03229 [Methylibium sp. T29-B]
MVGVLFRAAAEEPAADELMAQIESLLGVAGPQALRYADPKRGQRRAMRLVAGDGGNARLDASCSAATSAPRPGSRRC